MICIYSLQLVADALLLIGVRGDPRKEAKTTVCDSRALLETMTPDDVSILRSELMGWDGGRDVNRDYSIGRKHLVSGPDSNPVVNIFEEGILATGAASLQGSPQLLAAYGRLKENARKLAVGVWLDGGNLLIVNNRRAAHGRTAHSAVFDGSDRWVQRVWVKKELQEGPGDFTRVLRFAS
jgi:L-asparagine oxygenase